jgi:hypothetical protein
VLSELRVEPRRTRRHTENGSEWAKQQVFSSVSFVSSVVCSDFPDFRARRPPATRPPTLGRQTTRLYNTGSMGCKQMGNLLQEWFSRTQAAGSAWRWMAAGALFVGLAGCASPTWRQQLQSEDPLQRIDGAIAAGKAKNPAALALLIDRLEDDDQAVRMYAVLALVRIEGTTLGYKYWASPTDLAHMAQRWRAYARDKYAAQAAKPHIFAGSPRPNDSTQSAPSTQPLAQEAAR